MNPDRPTAMSTVLIKTALDQVRLWPWALALCVCVFERLCLWCKLALGLQAQHLCGVDSVHAYVVFSDGVHTSTHIRWRTQAPALRCSSRSPPCWRATPAKWAPRWPPSSGPRSRPTGRYGHWCAGVQLIAMWGAGREGVRPLHHTCACLNIAPTPLLSPHPWLRPRQAHLVNFRYVPSQWRLLYNNTVSIGWLALLSAITHSKGSGLAAAMMAQLHAIGSGH